MQDPTPENITGRKVHVVNHEVNWGYVVLGIAAIYVFAQLSGWFGGNSEEDGLRGEV